MELHFKIINNPEREREKKTIIKRIFITLYQSSNCDIFQIDVLNEPRPGKKLLVLDIDYTLFDHRSAAEQGYELMRPYLHEFLTSAYKVNCCFDYYLKQINLNCGKNKA